MTDHTAESLTWAELDHRVAVVAGRILRLVRRRDRVAVLADQSLDYVVAFLAAQRVGAIAVPLYPPGRSDRLTPILADCAPAVVLTTTGAVSAVNAFFAHSGLQQPTEIVDIATIPDSASRLSPTVPAEPHDIAYLQYTSGSTRIPTGVKVRHANVIANARQALTAYGATTGDDTVAVSWLPLFHDMGLMLAVAAPIVGRHRTVLMDPYAFVSQPARWLRQLTDAGTAVSAAPNYAFGYTASLVSDADRRSLRLHDVKALINGAEPIRPNTVERFTDTFAKCGLRPEAVRASYGLAEATVLVAAGQAGVPPRRTVFDSAALAAGVALPPQAADEPTTTLVSCGRPIAQEVRIVHPDTRVALPDGEIGEIWVNGPNVGSGYWRNDDATRHTFGATIVNDATEGGTWLRTGDLGVRHDDELYVTGRIKDLIVIDGRNHYPQDSELTVQHAHAAIRPRHIVACGLGNTNAGEPLVVLAEQAPQADPTTVDADEVAGTVRASVARDHSIPVHDFVLVAPGALPRTSSGKIARSATREAYLSGRFARQRR
jgi:acyl-CoA synthetase (AMP-forming)/AMP-acid ligase II